MCPHQARPYGSNVTSDDRSSPQTSRATADGPLGGRLYEIRVDGRLGPHWAAWFDGLDLAAEDDGTTVIRGPLADQAALHGVLHKLRDLGIPLVSLTRLPLEPTPARREVPRRRPPHHPPGATS